MAATTATNMTENILSQKDMKAPAGSSGTRSKDSKTDSKMAQEILLELTKQQELLEKEKSEKFIAPSMLKQSTLESNTFGAGTIGTPTVTNRTINTMTPDFRHHPKQSRDIYTPSLSVSMSNNTFIDEKLQKRYSQVSSIHPRRRGVAATHAISGRLNNNNNNNYVENSNNNRNKNNNNRDDERGEKRLNEIEEQSDSGSNSVSNDDEEAAGAVVNGEKGDSNNNNNNNNNNVCDSEEKVSKERIKFSNVEERINYAIEKSKINYDKRQIYSGKAQYEQELDLNDDFLAMARKYGFNVGKENHVSSQGNNNDMEKVEIVSKQDETHLNLKLKDFISMHCDGDAIDDYYYSDENESDNSNSNNNSNENENEDGNYNDNE